MTRKDVRRGDVCWVDFGESGGNIQKGKRPAVVLQNDVGNRFSETVIVAPLTSHMRKAHLPTHVLVLKGDGGLERNSLVLAEQIHLINKFQIIRMLGRISDPTMKCIDAAVKISLAL